VTARTDITVKPSREIPREQARDARARAWAFVFDCYAKKEAARRGGPDDVRKDQNAHTAKKQYT
jgi:hypothetical protein